ncbi:hypothetical protein CE91St46_09340 [Eubacteriales bacterium]|nr:hypothetical protein CE91St46_09340 [Eubacteriales bacterium]GKH62459.1 hypothetical protein CE91St47_09280 [Eubacteriales bacterium]
MITLSQALKLTKMRNEEYCYLLPLGEKRFNSIGVPVKIVKDRLDMKEIKVYSIQPKFELYGPDFLGMEFEVALSEKHKRLLRKPMF